MEKNKKLTGMELFLYLVDHFGMTGYQAITTMIETNQDLTWFTKFSKNVQYDILNDIT